MRLKKNQLAGFTITELLIVVSIVAMIAAATFVAVSSSKEASYFNKAINELESIATAVEFYQFEHDMDYPPDVDRNIPPGVEQDLSSQNWPTGPWPGSVYDWDNGTNYKQISIRFCPIGGSLSQCRFPKEPWATNFGVRSAVYYCIEGACKSHVQEAQSYPGYCVNCPVQPSQTFEYEHGG